MLNDIFKWRTTAFYQVGSLPYKLRKIRIELFTQLLKRLGDNNIKILDIGGTETFWKTLALDIFINNKKIVDNAKYILYITF